MQCQTKKTRDVARVTFQVISSRVVHSFRWRNWFQCVAFFALIGPPIGACLFVMLYASVEPLGGIPVLMSMMAMAIIFSYALALWPALLSGMVLGVVWHIACSGKAFVAWSLFVGFAVGLTYTFFWTDVDERGSFFFAYFFPWPAAITGGLWWRCSAKFSSKRNL
ncbi:hypothetical protein [Serratia marcescens]|uniref:hypothetical protein n=1 Tax=Serratia marcescens TaxID=615 RepID=UPI0024689B71|nr:hypothetical protein [Serratia marcescens]WGL76559.1 hypothetical protein QFB82_19140 [Serratia marcescens]